MKDCFIVEDVYYPGQNSHPKKDHLLLLSIDTCLVRSPDESFGNFKINRELWNCPLLADVEKPVGKFFDFQQTIYTSNCAKT